MKFVLETGQNILIHSYDVGRVSISGVNEAHSALKSGLIDEWDAENQLGIFKKSISIRSNGDLSPWQPQNTDAFSAAHFLHFPEQNPEIVLLGTGQNLCFPPQDCLSVLQQQQVGYEVMDTAAACRTFNVLASEGRDVILAMLMIEAS